MATEEQQMEPMPEYGTLQDELDKFFAEVSLQHPKEVALINEDMEEWHHTKILEDVPKVGDVLPDFALPDENGNIVSSVDLRAQGPIVILFFRGNWCGFCNRTLKMLRKYTPHLKARGASVVAISGQTIEESKKTVEDGGLNFSVLSDMGQEYTQSLGIAFVMVEKLRKMYDSIGVFLSKINDDDSGIFPIPATFVVDPDGTIGFAHVEVDYKKRADPVDILNALPPLKSSRRQSLSERIDIEYAKIQDSWTESRNRGFLEALRDAQKKGLEENALQLGDKTPDFRLMDKDGVYMDSKKLRKQGPLVVMFTLGVKSPLCKIQIDTMQRNLSKFEAKGAKVVVVAHPRESSSSSLSIGSFSNTTFPLLSDTDDNTVAKQFGLMYQLPGHVAGLNREELIELPMVATYVIEPAGKVIYNFVSVDPTKRPEPTKVLKAIPTDFQPKPAMRWGPFSLLANRRVSPSLRARK